MGQPKKNWNASDISNLHGKTVIVTGANSGIGFDTALELGRAGAFVIAACRDSKRGSEALAALREAAPGASFQLETLDLSRLASVRAFAERFLAGGLPLDVLVNNAGVMNIPDRELTEDGFERQMGTNHLGHFALTGFLLPALKKSMAPRVVNVSSMGAYVGRVDASDLACDRSYSPFRAYTASKLANILFTQELARRAPWLLTVAAHPGVTQTNLAQHDAFSRFGMKFVAQAPARGALPSLFAATGDVASGEYVGPRFLLQGAPTLVRLPRAGRDEANARALWDASEKLTHVSFAEYASTTTAVAAAPLHAS